MRNRVYVPIATGLREHAGAPSIKSAPLREFEVDLAKSVVEKIQYYGIRKWVYGLPDLPPIEPLIEISVSALLDGAQVAVKSFQGKGRPYRYERKIGAPFDRQRLIHVEVFPDWSAPQFATNRGFFRPYFTVEGDREPIGERQP